MRKGIMVSVKEIPRDKFIDIAFDIVDWLLEEIYTSDDKIDVHEIKISDDIKENVIKVSLVVCNDLCTFGYDEENPYHEDEFTTKYDENGYVLFNFTLYFDKSSCSFIKIDYDTENSDGYLVDYRDGEPEAIGYLSDKKDVATLFHTEDSIFKLPEFCKVVSNLLGNKVHSISLFDGVNSPHLVEHIKKNLFKDGKIATAKDYLSGIYRNRDWKFFACREKCSDLDEYDIKLIAMYK